MIYVDVNFFLTYNVNISKHYILRKFKSDTVVAFISQGIISLIFFTILLINNCLLTICAEFHLVHYFRIDGKSCIVGFQSFKRSIWLWFAVFYLNLNLAHVAG